MLFYDVTVTERSTIHCIEQLRIWKALGNRGYRRRPVAAKEVHVHYDQIWLVLFDRPPGIPQTGSRQDTISLLFEYSHQRLERCAILLND